MELESVNWAGGAEPVSSPRNLQRGARLKVQTGRGSESTTTKSSAWTSTQTPSITGVSLFRRTRACTSDGNWGRWLSFTNRHHRLKYGTLWSRWSTATATSSASLIFSCGWISLGGMWGISHWARSRKASGSGSKLRSGRPISTVPFAFLPLPCQPLFAVKCDWGRLNLELHNS